MTDITIFCPTVTYQYSSAGELSSHSVELPFDETIRDRFRQYVAGSYTNHPEAWERLRELVGERLTRLPDNEFVLRDAWLCGLIEDGGPKVSGCVALLARQREEDRIANEERAALAARIKALEEKVACTILTQTPHAASVRVRSLTDGVELTFDCRNIFDFGYVVNPGYEIAPGKKGGIVTIKDEVWYWQYFVDGNGWQIVRALTDFERDAVKYLGLAPPIASHIRM